MTIEQANAYFASLPEGFAPARQLQEALSAKAGRVDYLGVAGTAGKTTAAALTAAVLRAAGLVTGSYHAGCEPLSARIRVNGEPVAPELLAQAAETLSARETLPRAAAELAAAARCFGEAGCALAVVELPDAGLAEALPKMPVCAVTSIGPDGISASLERSAALAAGVMRKGSICVTAPEQPKAVVSELIVAAGKADCELVVPDPDDITFLEAEKFASRVDYGGYTVPLAFLGRHAAGSAAIAVELALALCKKGYDIPDEASGRSGRCGKPQQHPGPFPAPAGGAGCLPHPAAGHCPAACPEHGQGAPPERCHRSGRGRRSRGLLLRAGKRPDG